MVGWVARATDRICERVPWMSVADVRDYVEDFGDVDNTVDEIVETVLHQIVEDTGRQPLGPGGAARAAAPPHRKGMNPPAAALKRRPTAAMDAQVVDLSGAAAGQVVDGTRPPARKRVHIPEVVRLDDSQTAGYEQAAAALDHGQAQVAAEEMDDDRLEAGAGHGKPALPSLEDDAAAVLAVVPDAEGLWVRQKLIACGNVPERATIVVSEVLELNGDYPKEAAAAAARGATPKAKAKAAPPKPGLDSVEYMFRIADFIDADCAEQGCKGQASLALHTAAPAAVREVALVWLANRHLRTPLPYLRERLDVHKGHIAPVCEELDALLPPATPSTARLQCGFTLTEPLPAECVRTHAAVPQRAPGGGRRRRFVGVGGVALPFNATIKDRKPMKMPEGDPPRDFLREVFYVTYAPLINHENRCKQARMQLAETSGGLFPCGCCFGDTLFEDLAQCDEGHLFCLSCCKTFAHTQMGEGKSELTCIDTAGCKATFGPEQMQRFLDAGAIRRLDQMRTEKALLAADIENLEQCPFCDFAMVIDNPDNKIFECQNPMCHEASCRKCRRAAHIPFSCAEVDDKNVTGKRTYLEEELTRSLIKTCPKCKKPLLKDEDAGGCNKINCPCGGCICWICGEDLSKLKNGYTHFWDNTNKRRAKAPKGKCELWSDTKKLHAVKLKEGATHAVQEFNEQNPELAQVDAKFDPLAHIAAK